LVGLELDVYWANAGGGDPVALLERYGDRIRLLHMKDVGPDGRDAPFGEGSLPWHELLPAAARAGVEWYVVEQDEPNDPLRDVETAFRNLRARL
jgi:sugar phosphate isomerase/epimerase